MSIPPRDFKARFVKKVRLTEDVYSFYFERDGLDFISGQYIRMTLPIENPDNRGRSRLFTISSSPLNTEHFTITTRILGSSFKKAMFELKSGASIQFFGPIGRFVLDERDTTACIFLAGGIGITPFHSLVSYAHARKLNIPLTLFVSFSMPEETIFYNEFMAVQKIDPNIKVIYTVTKPEESQIKWEGEVGRIDQELIKKYAPDFQNSKFYIAGPPVMVNAMLELVQEMGIPQEKVLKENFVGY